MIAHLLIFMVFFRENLEHGDDGYLEVELSLQDPKEDSQTQIKQEAPPPPKMEALPTIPEFLETIPPVVNITPTIELSFEDEPIIPSLSLDVENMTDSFDNMGNFDDLVVGFSESDESARRRGKESLENSYLKRIGARIQRFKQYPREARIAKQEGTVIIQLTLDSDGKVKDKNITTSSGIDLLDEEALRIITRAEPLPKFPSALVKKIGSQLKFSTSINFKLSDSEN